MKKLLSRKVHPDFSHTDWISLFTLDIKLLTTFSDFRGRILEYISLAFGFKDLTLEKTLSTGHYRFYTFPIGDIICTSVKNKHIRRLRMLLFIRLQFFEVLIDCIDFCSRIASYFTEILVSDILPGLRRFVIDRMLYSFIAKIDKDKSMLVSFKCCSWFIHFEQIHK